MNESDLREVSILCSLDCILGDVVPEYKARVGAVHHPHPLLQHGLHVALALQLQGQTLPAGSDNTKRTVRELQERADGRRQTQHPISSILSLSFPFYHFTQPPTSTSPRSCPCHPSTLCSLMPAVFLCHHFPLPAVSIQQIKIFFLFVLFCFVITPTSDL